MTLSPQNRLGPYEIVEAIGAGGMGEVYRARDTRLGRDVALKVLPALFANDAERMARFEREEEVLASPSTIPTSRPCTAGGIGRRPGPGHGAGRGTNAR